MLRGEFNAPGQEDPEIQRDSTPSCRADNFAVVGSRPDPSTSRNDQIRFYRMFRGVSACGVRRLRSSFLRPRHDLGYGIEGEFGSRGKNSLFLRFSAGLD